MVPDRNQIREQALQYLMGPMRAGPLSQIARIPEGLPDYKAYDPTLGVAQQNWGLLHGKRQGDRVDPLGQSYDELVNYIRSEGERQAQGSPGYDPESTLSMMLNPLYGKDLQAYEPWGGLTEGLRSAFNTVAPQAPRSAEDRLQDMTSVARHYDDDIGNVVPRSLVQQQYESEAADYNRKSNLASNFENQYNTWLKEKTSPILAQQLAQMGLDFTGAPGVGSALQGQNMINAQLNQLGIKDLYDIGFADDGTMYSRRTGQALPSIVHNFRGGSGDGSLQVYLERKPDGSAGFRTDFDKPKVKFADDILGPLIGSVILGGFGGALGGALSGTSAGAGAATGAGTAAGAGATSGLGTVAGHALGQGIAGAVGAGLNEGNIGQGFLGGALTGALGAGIGGQPGQLNLGSYVTNSPYGQAILNAAAKGGVGGAVGSLVKGGDARTGALQGLVGGLGSAASAPLISSALQGVFGPDWANALGGGAGQLVGKGLASLIPAQNPAQRAIQQQRTSSGGGLTQAGPNLTELAKLPAEAQARIRKNLGIA